MRPSTATTWSSSLRPPRPAPRISRSWDRPAHDAGDRRRRRPLDDQPSPQEPWALNQRLVQSDRIAGAGRARLEALVELAVAVVGRVTGQGFSASSG